MTSLNHARHLQTYRQNEMQTADPGTILIRLYGGAIDFIQRALTAMENGDVANKGLYIIKAHDIISQFLASLDFEAGGDLARNLEGLYQYMLEQLMIANVNNNPKPLEVVISLLATLKEGWEEAVVAERKRVVQEGT